MENQNEIWKPITDYEGHYEMSNLQGVKSLKWNKERVLKPRLRGKYYMVHLTLNGKAKCKNIHQLMAETFLGHKSCGMELVVDHINGITTDNRLENLQIITNRENISKAQRNTTSKCTGVSWKAKNKKWASQILINGKTLHLGLFVSEEEASEYYQNALKNHLKKLPIEIKTPNYSSKYKGVTWNKRSKKWKVFITINGKNKYIGLFTDEIEAYKAYQLAEKELLKLKQLKC